MTMISIWDYAAQRVSNKGVGTRIKHSPKLHAFRSALSSKGSAASKGIAVGTMLLRVGISAIPIPSIATSLINVAQQAVEAKVRSHLHRKKLVGGPITQEETVKFELKELWVAGLDRYRWTLNAAIEQLNMNATGFNGTYTTKQKDSRPCDAWLELAEALAQAERRYTKLRNTAEGLRVSMVNCIDWAEIQRKEINKFKTSLGGEFQKLIEAETAEAEKLEKVKKGDGDRILGARHVNCENYCFWSEVAVTENEQWTSVKTKLATAAKIVSDPLTLETFATTSGDEYKMPKPA